MKVESDLKHAIVAASKGQQRNRHSYKEKQAAVKLAVEALDRKKKGKLTRLFAKYDAAQAVVDSIEKEIEAMGLNDRQSYRFSDIQDENAFVAAGGVLPVELIETREWKPEQCIARLVAAKDQKSFNAILAEYSIIWK